MGSVQRMETVLDLPAHPLFVHAPIILTPGTALLAALLTFRRSFRAALTPWFVALAGLTAFTSVLAMRSGEAFDKALKGLAPVDEHEKLATVATWMVVGVLLLSVVTLVLQRRGAAATGAGGSTRSGADPVQLVSAICLLLALGACVWMFRAGHEGAKAVWDGTIKKS
jgi:hypothetical protein